MYNFKSIILLTIIFFAGASVYAQEHQHSGHLSTLLDHYIDAKEALAEDNFEGAHLALSDIRDEVVENEEMNDHKEHARMHAEHHGSMVEAVTNAAEAETLDELRTAFKDISSNLIRALENQGFDDKQLFLQYCPMADNREGARWISDEKEIINPYMGQKMPGCGKVIEEINL